MAPRPLPRVAVNQPPIGSVILVEGAHGTAWQRMSSTGIWHSTAGRRAIWSELVKRDRPGSRITVIYVPPEDSNVLEPPERPSYE